jgi:tRNA pseudouridine13 synthase
MLEQFLTPHIPGTGGVIKESPEDFRVEEIPLYLPSGEGEHVYLTLEKRGITTLEAVRRLARATGVAERDMGYAGMKDARAVTVQTVSIPRVAPEALLALEIPGIRPLAATRHGNKLRLGHLAGNRFYLRLRETEAHALRHGEQVLEILSRRGVPNYFGPQRYGLQGNSHLIGAALVRQEWGEAVAALVGDPSAVQDGRWREAIEAFRRGDTARAAELFPPSCRTEREVLQRLLKKPDDPRGALRAVNPRLMSLYLSAYQSWLFDRVLDERLSDCDRLLEGDLAYKHANGACFLVTDPVAEMPRAEAFEISATGPLVGPKMLAPQGEAGRLEGAVLERHGHDPGALSLPPPVRLDGDRRPLRVPLADASVEAKDQGLLLSFSLPKGAYATAVLRELLKPPLHNGQIPCYT